MVWNYVTLDVEEMLKFQSHYTGRFIMLSVITNIYNKKTKGPTSMEFFTATGKLKKFFFFGQLEMFDVRTTGDTAHTLPHTRVNMGASIFLTAATIRAFKSARSSGNGPLRTLHEIHFA